MATKQTYICDGCEKEKGETNHWYIVQIDPDLESLLLLPWNKKYTHGATSKHICGMECLIKLISINAPKLKATENV